MRTKRKRTKSKICCTNGARPKFFFVVQGEISRHAALSVLNRFFLFFTPPRAWHRAAVPGTLPNRSTTDPYFFIYLFFYTTSWHRAQVLDALLKRSTQLCEQTNTTKYHCQTTTDLDQSLMSHAPLKGQARKNRCKP